MGSDAISDCNPSHLSLPDAIPLGCILRVRACVVSKCFQSIDSRQQHVFRPQSKYGSSCLSYIVSTYLFSHQTSLQLPSSDDSLHACSFARCLPYSFAISVHLLIRIRRIRTHGAVAMSLYPHCGRHILGLLWFSSWGPQGLSNSFAGVFARSVWRQRRATDVTGVPVCVSTCVFVYLFICQRAYSSEEWNSAGSHSRGISHTAIAPIVFESTWLQPTSRREWESCVCL